MSVVVGEANSSIDGQKDDVVETIISTEKPDSVEAPPSLFPEGGCRAWATVAGAFFVQFCGFGYSTSFGVFQDYYVRIHLTTYSPSTISWIGSVNTFLVVGGGIIAGQVYDRGYFYTLLWSASLLISLSLFMLSFTEEDQYYQVFLSQGLGAGIGMGMLYVPSVAVISHYFQRRRSLAMTIVASGSSAGAIFHPIMLNNTIYTLGFAKATRAHAGLISGLLLISCLLMRTRLAPPNISPNVQELLVKFSKDGPYLCFSFGSLFFFSGLFFPLFYMQLDAVKHGVDEKFAFYSLVILNGSSFVGRITSGFLASPFGVANLLVISAVSCGILIFSMIGVSDVASVVAISVFFGFFFGMNIALQAPMFANLADHYSEIGIRVGLGLTLGAFGSLVATPIDGALLTNQYHWWRVGVFSGVVASIGCVLYAAMAILFNRKKKKLISGVTDTSQQNA